MNQKRFGKTLRNALYIKQYKNKSGSNLSEQIKMKNHLVNHSIHLHHYRTHCRTKRSELQEKPLIEKEEWSLTIQTYNLQQLAQ